MFRGSLVALITPMRAAAPWTRKPSGPGGMAVAEGTAGLIPVGTRREPDPVMRNTSAWWSCASRPPPGRVPVMCRAAAIPPPRAIDFARACEEVRGRMLDLVVTPYYNKRRRKGCSCIFHGDRRCGGHPMFIYNIPPRSVVDMTPGRWGGGEAPQHRRGEGCDGEPRRPLHTRRAGGADFIQLLRRGPHGAGFQRRGRGGLHQRDGDVARGCARDAEGLGARAGGRGDGIQDRLVPLHDALLPRLAGPGEICGEPAGQDAATIAACRWRR